MSERSVPVIYQDKRKLVNVNFGSFENVVGSIGRRFKITGFQLLWKRRDNEEFFNIEDDEDLEGLQGVEDLVLLVKGISLSSKDKITAIYAGKTKRIELERLNFESIRKLIADRFGLQGDFQLQVKDESGVMIDIDNNADADANVELMQTVWVTTPLHPRPVVTKDMHLVKVGQGDIEYSITRTPDYKSNIIKEAAAHLESRICIPLISARLYEVEECLCIAYYASMDNKELHGKIQNMQLVIEKLCMKCDTTMQKIKLKVVDIVNALQCGFSYLLDGFEDYGLERFGSVGPITVEIQKEAASLEGAITPLSADERRKAIEQSEQNIKSFAEKEQSALRAARQHHISTLGIGFGFKKLITFGFYEGNKSLAEQEERFAREMREEQAREGKRLAELKEENERAMKEFDALMKRMIDQPEVMSEEAFQGANGGLIALQSVLNFFIKFWADNLVEFENINNTAFVNKLKKSSDGGLRKDFWTSKVFKCEAMQCVARFVAIQAMCEDFHKSMDKVLDAIHRCIRDNPTPAEARKKLPMLLQQFNKEQETSRK